MQISAIRIASPVCPSPVRSLVCLFLADDRRQLGVAQTFRIVLDGKVDRRRRSPVTAIEDHATRRDPRYGGLSCIACDCDKDFQRLGAEILRDKADLARDLVFAAETPAGARLDLANTMNFKAPWRGCQRPCGVRW
jgi:hypothetical protein